jgi:DNA-binding NarL/FixJ family response regulator
VDTTRRVQDLTHRERQILKLIAEYFSLSTKTVEKQRSNLMQERDLHNSSMLTSDAIEHGLLDMSRALIRTLTGIKLASLFQF